jgi:hypothetical protein
VLRAWCFVLRTAPAGDLTRPKEEELQKCICRWDCFQVFFLHARLVSRRQNRCSTAAGSGPRYWLVLLLFGCCWAVVWLLLGCDGTASACDSPARRLSLPTPALLRRENAKGPGLFPFTGPPRPTHDLAHGPWLMAQGYASNSNRSTQPRKCPEE